MLLEMMKEKGEGYAYLESTPSIDLTRFGQGKGSMIGHGHLSEDGATFDGDGVDMARCLQNGIDSPSFW